MLAKVDGVKTTEDFLALTPEEQKLVVATGAIAMRTRGRSSFEAMQLVLQVKDRNQRDILMRQLYETDEAREKGADSAINFVEWIETTGAAHGLSPADIQSLLSGVGVRAENPFTKAETAEHDKLEKEHPGAGADMIGEKLAQGESDNPWATMNEDKSERMRQRPEEQQADRITNLLQAARGETANPQAVQAAVDAAMKRDPNFINEMWKKLDADPARAAWANQLLEGTAYHRNVPSAAPPADAQPAAV